MNKKYKVHPDFRLASMIHAPMDPVGANALNYLNSRGIERLELDEDVQMTFHEVLNDQGAAFQVIVLQPKERSKLLPCIIHYHGGGFMLKTSPLRVKNMAEYVQRLHCVVIIPEYRLLPENPFPDGFNDAYATLTWVSKESDFLGINKDHIVLQGDSAGGALTAGVALKARDTNGPAIQGQILIYPVTDHGQTSKSIKDYWDAPVWDAKKNIRMWTQYLTVHKQPLLGYASPLHAEDFSRLPRTYIEVAEYDCLRDEGIALANVIEEAGVQVELVQVDGGVHGYDNFLNSAFVDQFVDRRIKLLSEIFGQ